MSKETTGKGRIQPVSSSASEGFDPLENAWDRVLVGEPSQPPASTPSDPNMLGKQPRMKETERAVAKALSEGKSVAEAARQAGVNEKTAYAAAKRDHVRAYMLALMDEMQITDRRLLEVLDRGLDARKAGLTKDGEVVDLGLDHQSITRYLEQGLKLRDRFPNPKQEVEHKVSGAIVLRSEDMAGIDPFAEVVEGEAKEIE